MKPKRGLLHEDALIAARWFAVPAVVGLGIAIIGLQQVRPQASGWKWGVPLMVLTILLTSGVIRAGLLLAERRERVRFSVYRRTAWIAFLIGSFGSLFTMVMASPIRGGNVLTPLLAAVVTAIPPLFMLSWYFPRRRGRARSCANCGYEQHPLPAGRVADVCPECGAAWRVEGGFIEGKQIGVRRLWLPAAAMWGMGFLVIGATMERIDALERFAYWIAPLSALRESAFEMQYVDDAVWRDIVRRSDTVLERRELIQAMREIDYDPSKNSWRSILPVAASALASGTWDDLSLSELLQLVTRFQCKWLRSADGVQELICEPDGAPPGGFRDGLAGSAAYEFYLYACVPSSPCGSNGTVRLSRMLSSSAQGVPHFIMHSLPQITLSGCDWTSTSDIVIPVMVVAMRPGSSAGTARLDVDGTPVAPVGALWSRVVPMRVTVERGEKK